MTIGVRQPAPCRAWSSHIDVANQAKRVMGGKYDPDMIEGVYTTLVFGYQESSKFENSVKGRATVDAPGVI